MVADIINTDNLLKLFYKEKEESKKYKLLYNRYYALYNGSLKSLENKEKNTENRIQEAVDKATEDLQKQLKEKNAEIALLRAQLNNNSSNSGIPTSRTPIGEKKKIPNTRKKSGRKKGGQKGHKRHKLEKFADDQIDEVITHDPGVAKCDRCGSDLTLIDTVYKDEYRLMIKVLHIRHAFNIYECTNCHKTFKVEIPENLKEDNQYGSSVQAMAAVMMNEGYVSMNRTAEIMSDLTDHELCLSDGFLAKINKRLAKNLNDFYNDLKREVIRLSVLHWDDTTISIGGSNAIIRFYGNEKLALYYAHSNKNMESLDDDGILISLDKDTVVVHDHLTLNYNPKFDFQNAECGIHLIRRLTKSKETTNHEWQQTLIGLLLAANDSKKKGSEIDVRQLYDDYDKIVKDGKKINKDDKDNPFWEKEKRFLNDLITYKDAYLLYATRADVPFTNNTAEKAIRLEKIRCKVSGQFTNLDRAQDHAVIRSYLETGKRFGYNLFELCQRAINGDVVSFEEMKKHASKDKTCSFKMD